jgi:hypothetical protein
LDAVPEKSFISTIGAGFAEVAKVVNRRKGDVPQIILNAVLPKKFLSFDRRNYCGVKTI